MSWADFYLICFIVGFALSLISFLGGSLHIPGLHHVHGRHGGVHIAHRHVGGTQVSPINFSTLTAFLAWFGAVGYLLTRFSEVWLWVGFLLAVAGGIAGGSIVFLFLVKVLLAHDKSLDPADYDMIGVLGHLTSAIREGGTGEMSFSQTGVRRSAAVRSDSGAGIPRGTEVVVTRYDKGIAYVRPWEELSDSKETV
jgi:membrane protein implicated in regulation of membrane protease activity